MITRRLAVLRIRYQGAFDFDGMYSVMRSFFDERNYEFFEKKYKQKVKPLGDEIEITWDAWRPINDYVRNRVDIFMHLWDINEIDILKNGKKKRVFRARMLIEITSIVELDYMDQWESSQLLRYWRKFYNYFILREDIKTTYEDKLWYNTIKLHQRIKQFLDMESHSDVYDDMW